MRSYCFLILFYLFVPPFSGSYHLISNPTPAQQAPIIFIYDASGSMWGQMEGRTKVEIAREVLSETIDQLEDGQQIGFVAYGHRRKGDCEDVEYLVDESNSSRESVKNHLNRIKPLGKTPLAFSALEVIEKLKISGEKATIILITDGIESCGGDLCEVVQKAKEAGVDFRMHIVGFGLSGENLDQLKCAAQAGNGNYYDAGNANELGSVLEEATHQTVDEPQYTLAVYSTKNNKPIDAWVKAFRLGTETEAGGTRTYQDTGFAALPPGIYDLVVQPLENSDVGAQTIREVEIKEGEVAFRHVSFDAGKIKVFTSMNKEGWDATVRIFFSEDGKPASGGRTYGKAQYFDVSPGTYDINLNCLRINGLETNKTIHKVIVNSGDTTIVGHNFITGTARIGALGKSGLMDATVRIAEIKSGQSVGANRTYTSESSNPKEFLLNPGTYQVTLTSVREFKGEKRSFEMTIREGETFEKMVQF